MSRRAKENRTLPGTVKFFESLGLPGAAAALVQSLLGDGAYALRAPRPAFLATSNA